MTGAYNKNIDDWSRNRENKN